MAQRSADTAETSAATATGTAHGPGPGSVHGVAPGTGAEPRVHYDPYDTAIVADPYPVYARLRDEAPLYYNPRYDFWALSRHADVERALLDWKVFSNRRSDILELVKSDFDMPEGVMMFEDPPEHTMLRGLMARVFLLHHLPRPAGRDRRVRHHRRTGRDDADAGHRHVAGHPRVRAGLGARCQ